MRRIFISLLAVVTLSFAPSANARAKKAKPAAAAAVAPAVTISVDATEAPRKIFHAKLSISAAPGPLTLYYPKWLPGEHAPTGPIVDLAGLKFYANGQEIAWQRDPVDMYAIHLTVPAGASSVQAQLDYLSPAAEEGFSNAASATAKLAMISWNQVLLYPAGFPAEQITFTPSLTLPQGWQFGTALTVTGQNGNNISFAPLSLYNLVDSPVLAGEYFRKLPLRASDGPVSLDIAADSAAALAITNDELIHFKNLVAEVNTFFGAHHYNHYDFLLTLSDHTAHFGLEHHQSSDDRINERSLVDPALVKLTAGLLPHEYTHSWNGKYRRPKGLSTANYQDPMIGNLLWVYEGLTTYLGQVFSARSGLMTPEVYRDELAATAAQMDRGRPGRTWRNLQDTATDAQNLYDAPQAWTSWRRSVDFYPESELIWLEADTIIRRQSNGQKSMDDFGKLFYGAPSTGPKLAPYTFDDIVNALNQIVPYDWRDFLTSRLQSHGPGAPLGGITNSGWRLVYTGVMPDIEKAGEEARHFADFSYSLGFTVNGRNHALPDVIVGSPAYTAGIGPGMVLVAVNGRAYTKDILREALRAGQNSNQPLELLIKNGDYFKTYNIDYHGGEQYPHLVQETGKPDVLSQIIAAHAK